MAANRWFARVATLEPSSGAVELVLTAPAGGHDIRDKLLAEIDVPRWSVDRIFVAAHFGRPEITPTDVSALEESVSSVKGPALVADFPKKNL